MLQSEVCGFVNINDNTCSNLETKMSSCWWREAVNGSMNRTNNRGKHAHNCQGEQVTCLPWCMREGNLSPLMLSSINMSSSSYFSVFILYTLSGGGTIHRTKHSGIPLRNKRKHTGHGVCACACKRQQRRKIEDREGTDKMWVWGQQDTVFC